MTHKKKSTQNSKTSGKKHRPKKAAKSTTPQKPMSRSDPDSPAHPRSNEVRMRAAVGHNPVDENTGYSSDGARDKRLHNELEKDSHRSAIDRHRERLTAVEAEEDGVRDNEDEDASEQRELVLRQVDAEEELS